MRWRCFVAWVVLQRYFAEATATSSLVSPTQVAGPVASLQGRVAELGRQCLEPWPCIGDGCSAIWSPQLVLVVGFVMLLLGFSFYGPVLGRIACKDADAQTPALSMRDDIDFLPLPDWKVFLIQLLNIAGLGPIFGPILGAVYGGAVFFLDHLWLYFLRRDKGLPLCDDVYVWSGCFTPCSHQR